MGQVVSCSHVLLQPSRLLIWTAPAPCSWPRECTSSAGPGRELALSYQTQLSRQRSVSIFTVCNTDRNPIEVRKDAKSKPQDDGLRLLPQGLLPLPENQTGFIGFTDNPDAVQYTFPPSCHRPKPTKQRDAFAALQSAIVDLSSSIKSASAPA